MEKEIQVVEIPISELKDSLGNPRKITTKGKKDLQASLKRFGDFGVIVIDEDNNILSGHQRVQALYATQGNDAKVLCKKLIGYTEPEKRAISIKANTHAGDWCVPHVSYIAQHEMEFIVVCLSHLLMEYRSYSSASIHNSKLLFYLLFCKGNIMNSFYTIYYYLWLPVVKKIFK